MKRVSIVSEIVVLLFITMFIYAAVSKLLIFHIYKMQLDKQPFDDALTPFLAWGIPAVEMSLSLLLIIPKTRNLALYFSTLLMVLFTGYVILIITDYYGSVPCTCGGVISQFTWTQHLWFNLFFVIGGIIAIISNRLIASDQQVAS